MEEWRKIKDCSNYSVSNLGNIRNDVTNRLLQPTIKGGYVHITLTTDFKKRRSFKVHRLVGIAFIENPNNNPEVDHINQNKIDNRLCNLRWFTKKENNNNRKITENFGIKKNKPVIRIDINTGEILQKYVSIKEAGTWAFNNKLTNTIHNGRNCISNCLNECLNSAYGFLWKFENIEEIEGEIWKQVDPLKFNIVGDVKHKYYVSNLGRFKNCFGNIIKENKPTLDGYLKVSLWSKTYFLHRVVALTFLENPYNKEQVNHIDGNKLNNKVENLEFATGPENQQHKHKMGLGNCKTTKINQFDLNGNFIKEHKSIVSAAKEYNVSPSSIRGVLTKYRKTSAGFIWKYLDE